MHVVLNSFKTLKTLCTYQGVWFCLLFGYALKEYVRYVYVEKSITSGSGAVNHLK